MYSSLPKNKNKQAQNSRISLETQPETSSSKSQNIRAASGPNIDLTKIDSSAPKQQQDETFYDRKQTAQNGKIDQDVLKVIHLAVGKIYEVYSSTDPTTKDKREKLPQYEKFQQLEHLREQYSTAKDNGDQPFKTSNDDFSWEFYGDNHYVRPAGSTKEDYDYPKADLKANETEKYLNLLTGDYSALNKKDIQKDEQKHIKLNMLLAGVAAEPDRYKPAQITNMLAFSNSDVLTDSKGNSAPVFDALTMTTGTTDPNKNPTDDRVKGVGEKVTSETLEREVALVSHIYNKKTGNELHSEIKQELEKGKKVEELVDKTCKKILPLLNK